jgi:hypothetical protein
MRLSKPYVLATALFNEEKTKPIRFPRTIEVIDEMLKNNRDLYYAHTLKCAVFRILNNGPEAKSECEAAITINPRLWPAHENLGKAYLSDALQHINRNNVYPSEDAKKYANEDVEKSCPQADKQFQMAEAIHSLKYDYPDWILCLQLLGRAEAANRIAEKMKKQDAN